MLFLIDTLYLVASAGLSRCFVVMPVVFHLHIWSCDSCSAYITDSKYYLLMH